MRYYNPDNNLKTFTESRKLKFILSIGMFLEEFVFQNKNV